MKKSTGIQKRLLFSHVILTVAILLVFGTFIYLKMASYTEEQYNQFVSKNIMEIDRGIINYIDAMKENVKMLSTSELTKQIDSRITSYVKGKSNKGIIKMDPLKANAYEASLYKSFQNYVDTHEDIQNVFVGVEENGGFLEYPAIDRKVGYDSRKRDWYKNVSNNPSQIIVSDARKSIDGDLSINFLAPIKLKDKLRGVMGMSMTLDDLAQMDKEIKIGNRGYLVIVDKKGTILANPKDGSTVFKNIKQLGIKGLENLNNFKNDNEMNSKDKQGNKYLVRAYKSKNKDLGWTYLTFVDNSELREKVNFIGRSNLKLSIVFIFFSILVAYIIANKISKPIKVVAEEIKTFGTGDFSGKIDNSYLNVKNEIGEMAIATENMKNHIGSMLLNVKDSFNLIHNKADHLNSAVEEMNMSSIEVNSATQEVTKGIVNQTEQLEEIKRVAYNLEESLEAMINLLSNVNTKVNGIESLANRSNGDMVNLAQSVKNIEKIFSYFTSKIDNLNGKITQIDKMTNLINAISEQTNLLALNAAIESARAGEAGKGFSVVADEVRKLSEQTKASADNINNLIQEIVTETSDIIKSTQHLDKQLEVQDEHITKGISSFNNIVGSVQEVVPSIRNLNEFVQKITDENQVVMSKVENSSASAQEISASSEEISASTEAMRNVVENVSKASEELDILTVDFQKEINKFKLEDN
ncbi:methyl-accepting chemotaxis protein [Hathewaya limosa]|uniref:Methyl-accepting chemotaxis protein n=1 Tax=Hathewaya limosa TaxID=1536 RepID=A0ABU0JPP1_HATLI|nr:methyl-accepting chemotaxis protein [Hathewaya limosa]MDQ0479057.1 methyl-accepting chemotaxis protein [Hathewaya limosa]